MPRTNLAADVLQVTSQSTRFATDAVETPASKDVLIKGLSISVNQRELLDNAEVHIKENCRYVLVGRNGEGKSTLLKAIAEKRVPSIPWGLHTLLLGQTSETNLEGGIGVLKFEDRTVLQHVLMSDTQHEALKAEAKVLSDAFDSLDDPTVPVKAYRELYHQRLLEKQRKVQQLAERRSGARGLQARKLLVSTEEEVNTSSERIRSDLSLLDPSALSTETSAAADMLTEVQSALEMMDASAAEGKARQVLLGLGFTEIKINAHLGQLSGGWRSRCDLACALCQTGIDILLLDEPTNFLDLPSIIWLQAYLNEELKNTTLIVVSHDRDFCDQIAESELLILRNRKIEHFKGTISMYEHEKWKMIKWKSSMQEAQSRQKKHMEQTIENNLKAAKRSGDDKKLKQSASRKKKLENCMGMEVSAKGTRFKLNRDLPGHHTTNRAGISIPNFDPPVQLSFPSMPSELRFPGALASLENVCFSYPRTKSLPNPPQILTEVSLTVHQGSRTAFLGLNGSGKSTLAALLDGRLTPTKGTLTRHPRARVARFDQLVVEELNAVASAETALGHLISHTGLSEPEARSVLGDLGLRGPPASDVLIGNLSGGQKVRLAFAKVVWNAPHLLVLDEVTTHLDADTIVALVRCLRKYEGALVVVSHDRYFVRTVVEGASVGGKGIDSTGESDEEEEEEEDGKTKLRKVYRLVKGRLKALDGGMEEYEAIVERGARKLMKSK